MKKFSEFVKGSQKKTPEGYLILQEPIHFKNSETVKKTPEGHVILQEPIHFRSSKSKQIDEQVKMDSKLYEISKQNHKYGMHHDLSKKLADENPNHINDEDTKSIAKYADHNEETDVTNSSELNKSLIRGEKPSRSDEKMHNAIKNNVHQSKTDFHAFSGTSRDFEHLNKSTKNGIFHSPAHISTTHDPNIADEFARGKKSSDDVKHIIHIHVKHGNKILHISHKSGFPREHETIIPSGTSLKYSHSTKDEHHKIHHFTIHSQE